MVGTLWGMRKPTRIGPKKPRKVFVAEWREHRGLTQKQLGERFNPPVTDVAVSRWETGKRKPPLEALADALQLESPADLYRHPDQPSADALLRGQPESVQRQAIAIIEALRKTGS